MDVNYLLDYPIENDASSEVSSLEEIIANVIENLATDKVKDDIIDLDSVMRKEALKALTTPYKFFIAIREFNPRTSKCNKKN
ncbi:hypothetical protein Patl1_28160 [Pistacia atlantica]|uniref:Uncharacterized protein n=1 Tax=Pistacia atlantica TaxID=434234 RepID=A0ACC1BE99_9ROSI|nr:hypothetical protein Patl1_28160 [Pistacia atlantica]